MLKAAFTWLSVNEFKRLKPVEKQAYLQEVVTHLADQFVGEARSRAKPRRAKARKRD